jgi:hypothetical protein
VAAELEISRHTLWRALSQEAAKRSVFGLGNNAMLFELGQAISQNIRGDFFLRIQKVLVVPPRQLVPIRLQRQSEPPFQTPTRSSRDKDSPDPSDDSVGDFPGQWL